MKRYMTDLVDATKEKERIGAELDIATQIQKDMLPCIYPAFPCRNEFDVFASMDPAKEVGGDFYDFFLVDDDHLGLVIADVSSKGVPAALFMVIAKTLLKDRLQTGERPAEALENVNNQLAENNEAHFFVTVWAAVLEISTGRVVAVNAGHEHPAIRRNNGSWELDIYKHSLAVGIFEDIPYHEHTFQLYPGDRVFVYTDGLPESQNAEGELYRTDRMIAALNAAPDNTPEKLVKYVHADVDAFVGGEEQFDDLTMLCLQYDGPKD
jgi:sigma-B regulation protein RsbU (phosphoserine phosphatase)